MVIWSIVETRICTWSIVNWIDLRVVSASFSSSLFGEPGKVWWWFVGFLRKVRLVVQSVGQNSYAMNKGGGVGLRIQLWVIFTRTPCGHDFDKLRPRAISVTADSWSLKNPETFVILSSIWQHSLFRTSHDFSAIFELFVQSKHSSLRRSILFKDSWNIPNGKKIHENLMEYR